MTFPSQKEPQNDDEFRKYLYEWMRALNDWHYRVDTTLAMLEGRTRDIKWILVITMVTGVVTLVGLLVQLLR